MKPLQNLVVVELAGSIAGAYCAKMFADGGASVSRAGPSKIGRHQEAYLGRHKSEIELNDVDWSKVDVVIESSAPSPLDPLSIAGDHLIRVQISPFGMTGERAHWSSTDLVDYALGGHAYLYGDPDREPLQGPPDQPAVAAGLYGFIGAMAGLLSRDRLGHGQTVDVSHIQVMVALHQVTLLRWLMTGNVLCRMGNRYTGQGQPNGPYRCADGWASIIGVSQPQVESILAVTGLTHLLDHPDITSPMDFQSHPQILDGPLNEWLSTQRVADVVELFQAMRIPATPLLEPQELLDDPQLVAREFFEPLAADPARFVPGQPFTLSHHQDRGDGAWQPGAIGDGPLSGLKVLDLARVWAGPLCARILCDLGAEVIWVEAPWHRGPREIPQSMIEATRLFPNDDPGERQWNRNTHFVKYSLGKKSLAVDLQTSEGQKVLAKLVPQFHVLLENFSTRVMPQFGFDEDRIHELNPDLIYLTMPGYGRTGPAENWLAYGSCVDSHAALSSMTGYADQNPWKGGIAWPDPIAGLHATSAVLSTLWSGLTSGTGGLTIEAAQFESTVAAIGDRVLEAQIDGPFVPQGNRGIGVVAQGIYRCAGEDDWIAISAPDEAAFLSLADMFGLDRDLAGDHDALDEAITRLVRTQNAADVAARLQEAGVPSGKVTTAADMLADPHLASRQSWATFDQPEVGEFTAPVTPIMMSTTMPRPPSPAPLLGEHNRQVLAAAGFDEPEISRLERADIIVTEPPQ